jgi:hypothetical protein
VDTRQLERKINRERITVITETLLNRVSLIINTAQAEEVENIAWLQSLEDLLLEGNTRRRNMAEGESVELFKRTIHSRYVTGKPIDVSEESIELWYVRSLRDILNKSVIESLLQDYKHNKNDADTKKKLIDFLDDYRYILDSIYFYVLKKTPKRSLKPVQNVANNTGMGTGEIFNVIQQAIPVSWAALIGLKLRLIFPFVSYFFYGIAAFIATVRKRRKLFHESALPRRNYWWSTFLGALGNFIVFALYMAVFGILLSQYVWDLTLVVSFKVTAMTIAAVGSGIGWVCNDLIDTWRSMKEVDEMNALTPKFGKSGTFNFFLSQLKKVSREEREHCFLGIFMVVGMFLLAMSFTYVTPDVPYLNVSCLTAAYITCFVTYASKEIWKVIKHISDCICCCDKRGEHIEAQSLSKKGIGYREVGQQIGLRRESHPMEQSDSPDSQPDSGSPPVSPLPDVGYRVIITQPVVEPVAHRP